MDFTIHGRVVLGERKESLGPGLISFISSKGAAETSDAQKVRMQNRNNPKQGEEQVFFLTEIFIAPPKASALNSFDFRSIPIHIASGEVESDCRVKDLYRGQVLEYDGAHTAQR